MMVLQELEKCSVGIVGGLEQMLASLCLKKWKVLPVLMMDGVELWFQEHWILSWL